MTADSGRPTRRNSLVPRSSATRRDPRPITPAPTSIARGVYSNAAKLDLALQDAEAALRLDAGSVPALLIRGYTLQRKTAFEAARADFDRAIDLDPRNIGGFLSRGNLRLVLRNWPDAQSDFEAALRLAQDSAPAHVGRGRVYLETGQLDSALSELNTAYRDQRRFPLRLLLARANLPAQRRHRTRHRGFLARDCCASRPQRHRVLFRPRAASYIAKGDYARAISDFNTVLEIAPDNGEARQLRQSAEAMQAELQHVPTGVNRDSKARWRCESNALIRRRIVQCVDRILLS